MIVDIKSAIHSAIGFLKEFQEFFQPDDIRLEETEYDDAGDWLITLSYRDTSTFDRREYKIFRVDGNTGAVKSMKVRTLQPIE
jgi:hypothetical protein